MNKTHIHIASNTMGIRILSISIYHITHFIQKFNTKTIWDLYSVERPMGLQLSLYLEIDEENEYKNYTKEKNRNNSVLTMIIIHKNRVLKRVCDCE